MNSIQLSILSDEESEPAIHVVAEEQGKAILPCNVSRPLNDSIDLILWFRGDAETALYSLDARKANGIQRAKHLVSDDLSSRAYIDITSKPTALVVDSVKATDMGEYKCRIDFRKGRTQYRTVHLDVIVPPKEVIIMDEYGQRLRDPVGPFNEGAHLTIICEAEGGKPRPSVVWYKDSSAELVDDSYMVTPQGIVRNELVITRLLRTDHRSQLTCLASNSNLTKAVITASITLELNLRPLDVRITTIHRPLLADQPIEVVCESGGSRPPALVTWWKGSKRLGHSGSVVAAEQLSANENLTTSTVQFVPAVDDNGKILSCRADHSTLPDSALEDSWILDIYYKPRLTVSYGASIHHDQLREGSNVSFECHVMANPPVGEISWKYDQQKQLLSNSMPNVDIMGTTLVLSDIRRHNSGKYRCVAANAEGVGESDDIVLKTLYAPVCRPDQRIIYGVGKREPIQVPCDVEADPPQVSFRWSFNNSYEVVAVKNFVTTKLRSVATYAPRTKYGYGELYCWARNKLGEQLEPCVYQVIPAGPPQPVRNCLVGNQSTDGLVVKCEPGDDGGLEQSFHLEIYESEDGRLQSNWTSVQQQQQGQGQGQGQPTRPYNSPVFEVTGLPIATSFVLVLYAANAKGRSNYVTLTGASAKQPFKDEFTLGTLQFGLKPVIYILISVVGLLVILATIIMIITKIKTLAQNKVGRHKSLQGGPPNGKIMGTTTTTTNSNSSDGSDNDNDINADNINGRNCVQNGVQMGTLYVKAFDVIDGIEGTHITDNDFNHHLNNWDHNNINSDKFDHILGQTETTFNEPHVTIAYEQRHTPEGDAYVDRITADWITNGQTTLLQQPLPPPPPISDYKKLNRYLMPANGLVVGGIGDHQTIIMTDDEVITTNETPLMNGIYFTTSYTTTNTHNTGRVGSATQLQHQHQQQHHKVQGSPTMSTTLSTPV
ncbi:uncharacterized protein LOC128966165 [Oppia nitens]|uniref:uncharacterized protein LOC128966165 n=1 Tax=Oppia nitens TaxID=1686743 RepID=UPI0023DB3F8F|nr:uncharacterized protein LOC128966165 [Oppia nitens]